MRHTGLSYKHMKQVVLLYISILSPHFAHSSFPAMSGWSLLPIGIGWSLLSNWHRVVRIELGQLCERYGTVIASWLCLQSSWGVTNSSTSCPCIVLCRCLFLSTPCLEMYIYRYHVVTPLVPSRLVTGTSLGVRGIGIGVVRGVVRTSLRAIAMHMIALAWCWSPSLSSLAICPFVGHSKSRRRLFR